MLPVIANLEEKFTGSSGRRAVRSNEFLNGLPEQRFAAEPHAEGAVMRSGRLTANHCVLYEQTAGCRGTSTAINCAGGGFSLSFVRNRGK
jgi:hypothetical protein